MSGSPGLLVVPGDDLEEQVDPLVHTERMLIADDRFASEGLRTSPCVAYGQ
ncbi:hypothetical protein [Hyphomicrobium sulfonivorans]|uniref:hypothetical protein n=1 Tax=Hyphomicrobium sulfonivorans TaxID=121290 RepID=UPI0015709930|nr:hypothetical protein [Hyphomicrobium sulfonivorans]MBI1649285.1 hypothetical protein [Hyphomicrobium sulfonivorans]